MHDDASGPKADALDLRLDQGSVLKGSIVRVCGPECIDDHGLDLGCRDPRDRSGLAPAALGEHRGDVIAIADAALLGRARRHRVAAVVKMRPIRRAAEAARLMLAPLRLPVSFSWTASNTARSTMAACSPIARTLVVDLTEID